MPAKLHDLVIKNGILVSPNGTIQQDLAVDGGKIAAVGQDLCGKRSIEADGKYVLPGAVDPHVHLETPVGETCSSDDWFTGTRAAAYGGTTCVIDFVEPAAGEKLTGALNKRKQLAQSKAVVDFGLHMTIVEDSPGTLAEIAELAAGGCTSFKTYLTYEGFRLSDAAFLNVLCAVQAAGGITLVHAENDAIITRLQKLYSEQKETAPAFHGLSRPAAAEGEAIQRSLSLAEVAEACLYVVHISTKRGVEAVHAARSRGVKVFGETCPQYLLLTEKELSRAGFEGAKFVCSPPLRTEQDSAALWRGLAGDDLQSVGTDHCPFFFKGQKELGRQDFLKIPGGLPGIESRLALLYQSGVRDGRISLERWVEICCTNPARIFGLFPQKGNLEPGADADLVLFDQEKKVTLHQSQLHEQVDYTPYEGFELQGYPVMTMLRGRVIVENGIFSGAAGEGQYLARRTAAFS